MFKNKNKYCFNENGKIPRQTLFSWRNKAKKKKNNITLNNYSIIDYINENNNDGIINYDYMIC